MALDLATRAVGGYPADLRGAAGVKIVKTGLRADLSLELRDVQQLNSTPVGGLVPVQDPVTGLVQALSFEQLPTAQPGDGTVGNTKLTASPAQTFKGNATEANAQPQDIPLVSLITPGNEVGDFVSRKVDFDGSAESMRILGRTQLARARDTFNAADYGLIGDGGSHPLSQRYPTLALAQAVYPHAIALSDEIDWAAIQQAVNFAQSATFAGEGMLGEAILPSGYNVRTNRTIIFDRPVRARFGSMVNYAGTTGDAIIVGSRQPDQLGEQNTGYDLDFMGCRSLNGFSAAPPTGVIEGGTVGLRLVSIQMSRVRIRNLQGFTWAGGFMDTREVLWQAPVVMLNGQPYQTKRANVQQNAIDWGLVGYCGVGVLAASKSGLASVGANFISWRDLSTNWTNFQSDGRVQGVEYRGATSNRWSGLVEVPAPGAPFAAAVYGPYNTVSLSFLEGKLVLGADTYGTIVEIDNNGATLAEVEDLNLNGTNSIRLGPAASGPDASGYPTALSVPLNTTLRNTWGRTVSINLYADLVPTSTQLASVQVFVGVTAGALGAYTRGQAPTGVGETQVPLSIIVPAGHYYRVNQIGAVALSTARVVPLS